MRSANSIIISGQPVSTPSGSKSPSKPAAYITPVTPRNEAAPTKSPASSKPADLTELLFPMDRRRPWARRIVKPAQTDLSACRAEVGRQILVRSAFTTARSGGSGGDRYLSHLPFPHVHNAGREAGNFRGL